MIFMEAVQAMKEGKQVTRPNTYSKIYLYNTIFHWMNLHEQMGGPQELRLEDIEATDYEVVDENKDWNLADNEDKFHIHNSGLSYNIEHFRTEKVKKCRDLILEVVCDDGVRDSEYQKGYNDGMLDARAFINKKFGDLE